MKKTLFAALALVSMASCSNEEVLEVAQREAIAFDNAFVDNATRSVFDPSIKNTTIASFDVYGFVDKTGKIFEGTDVTGSGVTGTNPVTDANATWSYTGTPQYWVPGAIYNFCAVAPANAVNATAVVSNETEGANNTSNIITTTFGYTNVDEDQIDLLYSEATCVEGKASGNDKVRFTFRHLLSKVKFSFKNEYNGTNATIKVTDIKILDSYLAANVVLTNEGTTWKEHTNPLTLNFGDATDKESTENVKETTASAYGYGETLESYNEKLLIPSGKKEYTVNFKVELLVGTTSIATYEHTAAKVELTPEAGKSYDIKAVINPTNINPEAAQEQIQFTVTTVEDWTEGAANDVVVKTPANN